MIQGAAYDQVLKFVEGGTRPDGNAYSVTATNQVNHTILNFTTTPYKTGGTDYSTNYIIVEGEEGYIPYNDKVKNIFDLEGNVLAWTTEAVSTYARGSRGGIYSSSDDSASTLGSINPSLSRFYCGSLLSLYVML